MYWGKENVSGDEGIQFLTQLPSFTLFSGWDDLASFNFSYLLPVSNS